jgi:hypothetical protein
LERWRCYAIPRNGAALIGHQLMRILTPAPAKGASKEEVARMLREAAGMLDRPDPLDGDVRARAKK